MKNGVAIPQNITTGILICDDTLRKLFLELNLIKKENIYFFTSFKYDDLKRDIKKYKIQQIISEESYIQDLNILQWECKTFQTYFILGCNDPLQVPDNKKNYLMNKKIWEYTLNNSKDAIEGGGWFNSYNRESFSKLEMDEFSENVYKKLKPYLNEKTKILEIGCSTGLTMFKILPYVGEYHAVDLSATALKKNNNIVEEYGYTNAKFYNISADEIDQIEVNDFDIIIMNSVIQCFHGYNYFRVVLKKCLDKLSVKGIIFLGDIMDLDLKSELEKSLKDYKNNHPWAKTKLTARGEIFYSKGFFEDCRAEFPIISEIIFTDKICTVKNELTDFRYDAIIKVDRNFSFYMYDKKKKQFGFFL